MKNLHVPPDQVPPYMFTVNGAVNYSGLKRSRIYELIRDGKLKARHVGGRTLIVGDSLRAFLDGLPDFKSAA